MMGLLLVVQPAIRMKFTLTFSGTDAFLLCFEKCFRKEMKNISLIKDARCKISYPGLCILEHGYEFISIWFLSPNHEERNQSAVDKNSQSCNNRIDYLLLFGRKHI